MLDSVAGKRIMHTPRPVSYTHLRFKLDALLIHSGELFNVFLDDHPYPFKVKSLIMAQIERCLLYTSDGDNRRVYD